MASPAFLPPPSLCSQSKEVRAGDEPGLPDLEQGNSESSFEGELAPLEKISLVGKNAFDPPPPGPFFCLVPCLLLLFLCITSYCSSSSISYLGVLPLAFSVSAAGFSSLTSSVFSPPPLTSVVSCSGPAENHELVPEPPQGRTVKPGCSS